jgi:Domain of unknown function (DU1801)
MAKLKTHPTRASVSAFLKAVADESRRKDCQTLVRIMKHAVGAEPRMWGPRIVGFGHYHYKYASGRENDWFLVGFSPRKQDLTVYIMTGFDRHDAILSRLGKYKTSKSCLYIKRLADVDVAVLQELITASVQHMKANG